MKKTIAILLALALCLALCACGGKAAPAEEKPAESKPAENAPAETKPAETTPAETVPAESGAYDWSAETETYELILADSNVETAGCAVSTKKAIEYIAEKSAGHIDITPYFGGTLAESADLVSAVADGVADIAYISPALYMGTFPVNEIFALKYFTAMPDPYGIKDIYRTSMDTIPELQQEMASLNLRCIDVFATQTSFYAFRGEKAVDVHTPEDLKGLVIHGSGTYATVLAAHGITPLSMGPADWYANFERGIVDAFFFQWMVGADFGISELAGSYLMFGDNGGFGAASQMLIFNLERWDGLPEHVQALLSEGFRYGYDYMTEMESEKAAGIAKEEMATKLVCTIPEEEMQPWYDLALEQVEIWKEGCNKAGYDADAIFEQHLANIESYMKNN